MADGNATSAEGVRVLTEALLPLCDRLDPDEPPALIAWAPDALAYALEDQLATLGYRLVGGES